MVFVNDKKYACEACIKGHRSSSCHHADRPLFEVKKKGRPVSQCEKCRQLRQSRRKHTKCACSEQVADEEDASTLAAKTKTKSRFKPIAPALPHGLRSVFPPPSSVAPTSKQDSLLNPCTCGDVWTCNCPRSSAGSSSSRSAVAQPPAPAVSPRLRPSSGLDTLARVASIFISSPSITVQSSSPESGPMNNCCAPERNASRAKTSVPHSRPPTPPRFLSKRPKHTPPRLPVRGPDLPPLRFPSSSQSSLARNPVQMPNFPIPPMSQITPIAGTGCCCGFRCACPGCVEHRGVEHVSTEEGVEDCPGCGSCVDYEGGVELPTHKHTSSSSSTGNHGNDSITKTITASATSAIDRFFARAAALPPPPSARKSRLALDPMDITVYPPDLFSSSPLESGNGGWNQRGAAFGLVDIPKLAECCRGRCGCPQENGGCACGGDCDGCCFDHGGRGSSADGGDPMVLSPPVPSAFGSGFGFGTRV